MKNWINGFCIVALAVLGAMGNPETAAAEDKTMTVLITGANRGLGLEFARQLSARGYRIIGTVRKPEQASELRALGAQVEILDVADSASVKALAARLKDTSIDLLINNAGFGGSNATSFLEYDFDQVAKTLDVNSLGPMRVTQALYDSLMKGSGKKIIHISSIMGSIELNKGGYYGYRASKTALNMFNSSLAAELGPQGFLCVVLHPGWVQTRMGGQQAPVKPVDSIAGMLAVIDKLDSSSNGRFYDYQGNELPW